MSYCTLSEAVDGNGCPKCTSELAALRKVAFEARGVMSAMNSGCYLPFAALDPLRKALRALESNSEDK